MLCNFIYYILLKRIVTDYCVSFSERRSAHAFIRINLSSNRLPFDGRKITDNVVVLAQAVFTRKYLKQSMVNN